MFGWFRKLTQRKAEEDAPQAAPLSAPADASATPTPQAAVESVAAPMPELPQLAQSQLPGAQLPGSQPSGSQLPEAEQQESALVDVYTPPAVPEPPTVWPPEQHDGQRAGGSDAFAITSAGHDAEHDGAEHDDAENDDAEYEDAGHHDWLAEEQVASIESAAAGSIDADSVDGTAAAAADSSAAETGTEIEPADALALLPRFDGLVAAPTPRPAMPLSANPNFAGLGLAKWEPTAPRLLEPEAALTPDAQRELLTLFDDLFGPCGRYRLEWRTTRSPGDDAMFAQIMTADLVRRVQNTIADVAELERPRPPKAIGPSASEFLPAPEPATETAHAADDGDDEQLRRAS